MAMQLDRQKIRKAQNSENRKIGVNENCGGRKIRKAENRKASVFECGVVPLPMEGNTIRQTKNQEKHGTPRIEKSAKRKMRGSENAGSPPTTPFHT